IEAQGKYLIPGLVDGHIHFFQSGGLYTRPDAIDLRAYKPYDDEIVWLQSNAGDLLDRYLRCGVTTVIDVGGPMYNYTIRDSFNLMPNKPSIYITGPLVSTYQPPEFEIEDAPIVKTKTAEEARELVRKQLPFNPDFIKIWYIVLPNQSAESTFDIVKAAADEAHRNNVRVAIHATQLNTAKFALKAGADILVHSVEDHEVDEDFINLIKKNNAVYIPTLIVGDNYTRAFAGQINFTKEDLAIANPIPTGSLLDVHHLEDEKVKLYKNYASTQIKKINPQQSMAFKNLNTLIKGGVPVALGTDAGNIGTLHASSVITELQAMKDAGLSNAQVLKAASLDAYKVVEKDKLYGSIEEGKKADLVLLSKNPLEDLNALREIEEVIKHGSRISLKAITKSSPEELAQQQLNAYNLRDIDAFLEPYSDTVKIFGFPDQPMMEGKEAMRKGYEGMFENTPNLHCKLLNRIVQG
ncbi:MAG: amidohydrolase family protein, partial [Bacteroidota bacterium]